jgi:hypothetical protein
MLVMTVRNGLQGVDNEVTHFVWAYLLYMLNMTAFSLNGQMYVLFKWKYNKSHTHTQAGYIKTTAGKK